MEENDNETVALDSVGGEQESSGTPPAETDTEVAAEQAAIAMIAKARAEASNEDDAADGGEAADDEAPPTEAVSIPEKKEAEPPKADDKEAVLLQRLNQAEARAREAEKAAKTLADREARVAKWEKAAQDAAAGDPRAALANVGLTVEGLLKLIDDPEAFTKETQAAKKVDAVTERIQQLEAQLQREQAQRQVSEYKATLSREVTALKEDVPFLANNFTDPDTGDFDAAGMADAIFDLQYRLYHDEANPRDVSSADAAKFLNKDLENRFKRLAGKSKTPATNAPAAAKPATTPAKKPEQAVKKPLKALPDAPTADPDLADALAVLKSLRAKTAKEAEGLTE